MVTKAVSNEALAIPEYRDLQPPCDHLTHLAPPGELEHFSANGALVAIEREFSHPMQSRATGRGREPPTHLHQSFPHPALSGREELQLALIGAGHKLREGENGLLQRFLEYLSVGCV